MVFMLFFSIKLFVNGALHNVVESAQGVSEVAVVAKTLFDVEKLNTNAKMPTAGENFEKC